MPNDCWNSLTITANKSELDMLMITEFKDVPDWALEILTRGPEGVMLRLWSRWEPNFKLLETFLQKYPSCWIKNLWKVEDGSAGVWIGSARSGTVEIQQLMWEDMCLEEMSHRFREDMAAAAAVTDAGGVDADKK
jgi:hypothetical protein